MALKRLLFLSFIHSIQHGIRHFPPASHVPVTIANAHQTNVMCTSSIVANLTFGGLEESTSPTRDVPLSRKSFALSRISQLILSRFGSDYHVIQW